MGDLRIPTNDIALVTPPLRLDAAGPHEVVAGYYFRRPAGRELDAIRRYLSEVDHAHDFRSAFEGLTHVDDGNVKWRPLPPEEWFYWVLDTVDRTAEGTVGPRMYELEDALYLSGIDVRFDAFFADGRLVGWNRFDGWPWLLSPPLSVTDESLRRVNCLYLQAERAYTARKELAHSIEMLRTVKRMNRGNPMTFLGLFAVLESFLTHDPRGEYDSLTRQIRSKVTLLGKRFEMPLDYSPFGGAALEKVWTRLYQCRSAIAPGATVSFDGDLKLLGNLRQAFDFLELAVRAVARQAVVEPDLVLDLRAC